MSQPTCARAGPRQGQKMLSPDSPGLTPKPAGRPGGLRELLMGCEVQTGGGPAWEGWGPARTPALCHARGPPVPALPCPHLPSAWSLGSWSPSCWICSRDAPAAVSQKGFTELSSGWDWGAESCSSGGRDTGIWNCGVPFSPSPHPSSLPPLHPPPEPSHLEKPTCIPGRRTAPTTHHDTLGSC